MRDPRFLGDLLLRRGLVTEDRMETLYATQKEKGGDIVDLIVSARLAEETAIARALAEEAERPYVESIETEKIATALATRVPITFAKNHKVLAFAEEDKVMHVLAADPFDTSAFDDLRVLFGKPIEVHAVAIPAQIQPGHEIDGLLQQGRHAERTQCERGGRTQKWALAQGILRQTAIREHADEVPFFQPLLSGEHGLSPP